MIATCLQNRADAYQTGRTIPNTFICTFLTTEHSVVLCYSWETDAQKNEVICAVCSKTAKHTRASASRRQLAMAPGMLGGHGRLPRVRNY